MSKKIETENIKEVKTENFIDTGTENSEEAEREVKVKDIVDKLPTCFEAVQPEVRPAVEMLKTTMKDYCFIQQTSLTDLEGEYELEADSDLAEIVSLVLTDLSDNTHSALVQSNSAHDVFPKRDIKGTARLMGSVMAFGAYRQIFCLSVMFRRWKRSLLCCNGGGRECKREFQGREEESVREI